MLVLRTCREDLTSYGGFQWPEAGPVEAPDWRADRECGHGLHGLPWGEGNGGYLNWDENAKWLVVEVADADVVMIDGDKCKFPRGVVVYCGDRKGATEYVAANGGAGKSIVGASTTAGDRGQATAGYMGQATAGYRGQATAGYRGQATAGYRGQATAGYMGQATACDRGQATAGDMGQATAGYMGQATAGDMGQATAGYRGIICIAYWDERADRRRIKVGYIGEDGIQPGVTYKLDDHLNFVAVSK